MSAVDALLAGGLAPAQGEVLAAVNIQAVGRLDPCPSYVLTDGFAIGGMPAPALAVWKGDRVAACVAAASVLAKVTRDRLMVELHEQWPAYDFARHKGYITPGLGDAGDRLYGVV